MARHAWDSGCCGGCGRGKLRVTAAVAHTRHAAPGPRPVFIRCWQGVPCKAYPAPTWHVALLTPLPAAAGTSDKRRRQVAQRKPELAYPTRLPPDRNPHPLPRSCATPGAASSGRATGATARRCGSSTPRYGSRTQNCGPHVLLVRYANDNRTAGNTWQLAACAAPASDCMKPCGPARLQRHKRPSAAKAIGPGPTAVHRRCGTTSAASLL